MSTRTYYILVCASAKKKHLKGTGAQGHWRHSGHTRLTRSHGQGGAIGSATEDPLPPIPPFQPTPYNAPPVQPNPYDRMLPPPVPILRAVTPVTQAHILPDPGSIYYPYSMPTLPSTAFSAGVPESESSVAFSGGQHSATSSMGPLSTVHVVDERLRVVSEMIQVVSVVVLDTPLTLFGRLKEITLTYSRNIESARAAHGSQHRSIFKHLETPCMLMLRRRIGLLAIVLLPALSNLIVLPRLSIVHRVSQKPPRRETPPHGAITQRLIRNCFWRCEFTCSMRWRPVWGGPYLVTAVPDANNGALSYVKFFHNFAPQTNICLSSFDIIPSTLSISELAQTMGVETLVSIILSSRPSGHVTNSVY